MITVIPAPRPEDDDYESWRDVVCDSLRDVARQLHFRDDDFVECDSCSSRPGSPALCAGCLANRDTIGRLKRLIDANNR